MKKVFFSLFLLLNILAFTNAQVAGNQYTNPQYINGEVRPSRQSQLAVTLNSMNPTLQADVLYNVQPTNYLAIFAVTQTADNIEDLDRYMNTRLDNFRKALLALGITESQIFTDFVCSVPKYEMQMEKRRKSKTANEVPIGFEMKKNIHIALTDVKLLDKIISAAAASEIYDLARVDVSVKDLKKVYEELRAEATKIIQAKAALYAPLGIKLIAASVGENFETYYPVENYEAYTAFSTDYTQAMNNQQVQQGKAAIKYASKDRTVVYSRLPYDQFDAVLRTDFVEPPIQVHYKMLVNYVADNTELAQKREADALTQYQRSEIVRKDEIEIRKILAANPPRLPAEKK